MHVSLLNSSRSELIILSKFASREERAWTAKRGRTSENRDKRGIFSASLRRSKFKDFVVSRTISQPISVEMVFSPTSFSSVLRP